MTGLGLRYCKNHPDEPLMLHQGGGIYWRCEHPTGCAYTEDAMPRIRSPRAALLSGTKAAGRGQQRRAGGGLLESSVERAVINGEAVS